MWNSSTRGTWISCRAELAGDGGDHHANRSDVTVYNMARLEQ